MLNKIDDSNILYYDGKNLKKFIERNNDSNGGRRRNSKTKKYNVKKRNDKICYTGIGARKSGNHTKKQFLNVMDKNFKDECSQYIKSLKCKSCKKYHRINNVVIKKTIKAQKKNKTYKMSNKTEEKLVKQLLLCGKCKRNKTKKCDFKKYISFSGAKMGKCVQNI